MTERYLVNEEFFGYSPESYDIDDPNYPSSLNQIAYGKFTAGGGEEITIPAPPQTLHILGNNELNTRPQVAILGSRVANDHCLKIAHDMGAVLAFQNFGVITGLAFGPDSAGAEGALTERGHVTAFLPNSFHKITPVENTPLAEQILASDGALVSRYAKRLPQPWYKDRDLDMVGCAQAIILPYGGNPQNTEDPTKSGARLTIRMAFANNKPIIVYVPDRRNRGPLNVALIEAKERGKDPKGLIHIARNVNEAVAKAIILAS